MLIIIYIEPCEYSIAQFALKWILPIVYVCVLVWRKCACLSVDNKTRFAILVCFISFVNNIKMVVIGF